MPLLTLIEKGELTFRQIILHLRIAMNRVRYSRLDEIKNKDEIVNEARVLSSDYMDDRLIRSGLNFKQRKISQSTAKFMQANGGKDEFNSSTKHHALNGINCNRLNVISKADKAATIEAVKIMAEKRHSPRGCLLTIDDLSKVLMYVGEALEVRHPTVYTDILQQLNVRALVDVNLRRLFMNVAKELFAEGINWPKIVSFFAFAGGLAVDCVLNGSSIHVTRVKTWTVEYIESELADWIIQQGGWVSLFSIITKKKKTPHQSCRYEINVCNQIKISQLYHN